MTTALDTLKRPVERLIKIGVLFAALGALVNLVPFIGLTELGRLLLAGSHSLWLWAALVVIALSLGWMANGVALWLTHLADHRLQVSLRDAMVRKLGRVPLGWYSDTTSGAVRKVVQDDLEDLHHLVAHHAVEQTAAIVTPLAGLVWLASLNWRLALLAVLTLPIYALAYTLMMRGFGSKMQLLDKSMTRVSAAIVEFVHGIAVVKAFGQVGQAHRSYQQAVNQFSEQYTGWVRPLLRLEAFSSMALSVPVILLVSLGVGSLMLGRGWITPLELFAETLVAVVIPQSLLVINQSLTAQRTAMAAAGRIEALLNVEELPSPRVCMQPEGSDITFEQVRFGYDPAHLILDGVDLHCPAGTITALVGASGAGKSTLAKLVPRFHDVHAGRVLVGGADVREIDPRHLYQHVGFVLQDAQLVHGSVADNLRLGRPQASDEQVHAAARSAQIHQRIQTLPRGYDSIIGEDAIFSGGEAQRLSIARTLLADTPVLILDEATSHADPESEALIQDALSALTQGRTVLVIAHRLASISGVDQIVVLDQGRVLESGRHEQLLQADGAYARLWRASAETTTADLEVSL
ncbi:ABC transporter ATP-binding protein [Pseudomonas fluorescens]|uniref:ABC transporter ATP-binding protein n=1 Tax=Pseudomonas fluorescens TaxID=294 RepID=A0A944HCL1_PSEFL|nr:ABC transporter ATP-binding protein [Pseudomonas fluorescens]MBT2297501.1 ABC transporter ATP-binding protein [Pseudomonas fluorescens]MBT2305699.1 ABC transporter ATP-binding protein [Pseudomonas fluorescens]MBT2314278.1 ABC transporter ATP-binding protein [Pseudomonas fluorescens]MBT2319230.1 ABC transporter ATP-binding protein [Pseudomonas fluorescens]MBT2328497.1 ABC transporter ATP-binding protein [Pseudomonas fluorescens]